MLFGAHEKIRALEEKKIKVNIGGGEMEIIEQSKEDGRKKERYFKEETDKGSRTD